MYAKSSNLVSFAFILQIQNLFNGEWEQTGLKLLTQQEQLQYGSSTESKYGEKNCEISTVW